MANKDLLLPKETHLPHDFVFYDPESGDDSAFSGQATMSMLMSNNEYKIAAQICRRYKKIFMISSILISIVNVFCITYWLDAINYTNSKQSPTTAEKNTVIILSFLVLIHILWILNFCYIFYLLTFKIAGGRVLHTIMFWGIFGLRFLLNAILLLVNLDTLSEMLKTRFSVFVFATIVFVLTFGDVLIYFVLKKVESESKHRKALRHKLVGSMYAGVDSLTTL